MHKLFIDRAYINIIVLKEKILAMKKKLILLFIFIISLGSSILFAKQTSIKLALLAPFSGEYYKIGENLLLGAKKSVDVINSKGGLQGLPLEIVPIDDLCDSENAIEQAREIAKSKKYSAIIGHSCSDSTIKTLSIYKKANLLQVSPTATNVKITQQGVDSFFRVLPNDELQAKKVSEFVTNNIRSKNIAILYKPNEYSKGLADLVSENLVLLDYYPKLYSELNFSKKNIDSMFKKFKKLKIDTIYFAGYYPDVINLSKLIKLSNSNYNLIVSSANLVGGFDSNINYIKTKLSYNTKLKAKKSSLLGDALYSYVAVEIIYKAMKETNNLNGDVLAKWLHHNSVDTMLGKMTWDTNGEVMNASYTVYSSMGKKNNE